MVFPAAMNALIETLRGLPGIGPKSAQRMALQLIQQDRENAAKIARSIEQALERIHSCKTCRGLAEAEECDICLSTARDASVICIVESVADVAVIEQSSVFRGKYFVLRGRLSPIDGIGPDELGIPVLLDRLSREPISELILATNTTVEGEATAHYLAELAKEYDIKTTRIAHGVPMGGELEYVDSNTLSHAFQGRRDY